MKRNLKIDEARQLAAELHGSQAIGTQTMREFAPLTLAKALSTKPRRLETGCAAIEGLAASGTKWVRFPGKLPAFHGVADRLQSDQ